MAYFTLLSLSLIDNARGPAYPDILEYFNMSNSRGAFLFAWASFAGLLSNLTARWWLPKLGVVNGAMVALFLIALGSFFFGEAQNHGVWLLDFASFVLGLGFGTASVSMNLLIAKGAPPLRRRQFFAGLHSIYGFGSLSAPLLLSVFIAASFDWASFFRWFALVPLITLTLAFFQVQRSTRGKEKIKKEKKSLAPPITLSHRLSYGLVFGLYVASEIIVSSRLVLFLYSAKDVDLLTARTALSVFFLTLLGGRLLFAVVPIKGTGKSWLIGSCLSTIALYFLSLTVHPLLLAFSGLTMSYFFPVAMDWLTQIFNEGLEWMTASVLTTISVTLVLMHLGFGVIADYLGIDMAMALIPLLQMMCIVLLIFLPTRNGAASNSQVKEGALS